MAATEVPVVFGDDDRHEPFEVNSQTLRDVAAATALMVPVSTLQSSEGGYVIDALVDGTSGSAHQLCQDVAYASQPAPGRCTGWWVGGNLMVTAAHCLDAASCSGMAFVFGFEMLDETNYVTTLGADDVYFCDSVLARGDYESDGAADWGVFRTTKLVSGGEGRSPLPVRRSGSLEADWASDDVVALYMAGHPSGLPLKITGGPVSVPAVGIDGASVRTWSGIPRSSPEWFQADLDTFGGNSGSPVISVDAQGQLVAAEGILVASWAEDFVERPGERCNEPLVCSGAGGCFPDIGDYWAVVTRSTEFDDLIPAAICGDAACESPETCLDCPVDCAECPPTFSLIDHDFAEGLGPFGGSWSTADRSSAAGWPGGSGSPVAHAAACDDECHMEAGPYDLSGAHTVTLDYLRFVDDGNDAGEGLWVELWDGSGWVAILEPANDDNQWHAERVTLDPRFHVSDFRLRFRARNDSRFEPSQVDDVLLVVELVGDECQADGDCDDGDTCNGVETCAAGYCVEGARPECDDGNACTVDSCDPISGCENLAGNQGTICRASVGECDVAERCTGSSPQCPADGFAAPATPCGDPSDTECTDPDRCDGLGGCLANDAQAGTVCGDPGGECIVGDTCDGVGSCSDKGFVAAGSPCGSGVDDACTDPDTCDGEGTCQPNHEAAATVCGDSGVACVHPDTCDGSGRCVDRGFVASGEGCGDFSDTECTRPDSCDGQGQCLPNDEPATLACGGAEGGCLKPGLCDGLGACGGEPRPDGTACGDGSSDACTSADTCLSGICQPNHALAGTSCGSDAETECSDPDSCDGAGNCLTNDAAPGSACGDGGTPCVNQDSCDGAGRCVDKGFSAAGTSCGSGADTQCSDPDSCDGAGRCQRNHASDGTLCGDPGSACANQDRCSNGVCVDRGVAAAGTPCGDDSATVCTDPDSCDGWGRCAPNDRPDGTPCGPGSSECIHPDSCRGGACVEGAMVGAGTPCGDSDDTECSDPDACDGQGACLANDAPAGASCGDLGDACTLADSCDGVGRCADAGFQPAGTLCGDPGDDACTDPDSCDGQGACLANDAAAGAPCDDGDVCTDEACDGAGVCLSSHNSAPCDDGDACTRGDVCAGGSCVGGGECVAELVSVSGVNSRGWTTVELARDYVSMVVVCTPTYTSATPPGVVRLNGATSGSSFYVRVDGTTAGAVLDDVDVACFVVEEGVYTLAADGVTMEAARYRASRVDHTKAWIGTARSYANSYTNPVVLGQVMTYRDPDFSTFWCASLSSRTAPPNALGFRSGMTVSEDPDDSRILEDIGHIVIEAGSGEIGALSYVAALGADTVRGLTDEPPYSYSVSELTSVAGGVATQAGMDGDNGGWAVLVGPITGGEIPLAIDEDQAGDAERQHTSEQVGYIIFGRR